MPLVWHKIQFKLTEKQLPVVRAAIEVIYEHTFSMTGWKGRMEQNGLRALLKALKEKEDEIVRRGEARGE